MSRVAIIPGSFDPLTTGHYSLVLRASRLFDRVTVLVCQNFEKSYTFTSEERLEIVKAAFSDIPNVTAEIHSGWLYEYLNAHKPCVLVKGVRNERDFTYERDMAYFNFDKSGVETLLLPSEPTENDTSSTKVRALLEQSGDWKALIPQNAQKTVEKFYAGK